MKYSVYYNTLEWEVILLPDNLRTRQPPDIVRMAASYKLSSSQLINQLGNKLKCSQCFKHCLHA